MPVLEKFLAFNKVDTLFWFKKGFKGRTKRTAISESVLYNIEYLVQRFEKIERKWVEQKLHLQTPTDFAKHADRCSDYRIKD